MHNEHRQPRNDRPPRFHRDTDFPKPGQEPVSNCTSSHTSAQAPQWKGQERWSRGAADRPQNDFPSALSATFTRSKEPLQQMEFSGSNQQQRARNGDGGGSVTGPSYRRGVKDAAPAFKTSSPASAEMEGRGNTRRADRPEEHNNNRRMGGRNERPNSDHYDKQRDGGPPFFNSRGGSSGMPQEPMLPRDSRIAMGEPSHFQNGDMEHKRTGPIKPPNMSFPPSREPPPPKKNPSNNPGPKKRSGQGKGQGPRGPERSLSMEHAWKPGDQCLALYWEDSKVRLHMV